MKANRWFGLLPWFSVLFLVQCKTTKQVDSEVKFGAGEHLILGDEAYRRVFELPKDQGVDAIPRADGKEKYTYGTIVALAGDFYYNAELLDNDRAKDGILNSLNPFSSYNNVRKAVEAFKAEEQSINLQKDDPNQTIEDNNAEYLKRFGDEYLGLAVCNVDHFGWHNMKRYVKEHGKAIEFALKAHRAKGEERAELWRKALIYNGFADHFLTDAFAAGHIRVPRLQIIKWGKVDCQQIEAAIAKNESLLSKSSLFRAGNYAGGLSKMLHDNDSTLEIKAGVVSGGLPVTNAEGKVWKTRSDGELYIDANRDSVAADIVTEAVELSLREVYEAYDKGTSPKGLYAAAPLVPFLTPSTPAIEKAFPETMSDETLLGLLRGVNASFAQSVTQGVVKWAIADLTLETARPILKELPKLMAQFRSDVAQDLADDDAAGGELRRRLAPDYIEGYLNVH